MTVRTTRPKRRKRGFERLCWCTYASALLVLALAGAGSWIGWVAAAVATAVVLMLLDVGYRRRRELRR